MYFCLFLFYDFDYTYIFKQKLQTGDIVQLK